jgi:flavin-dependent dehydrogenase
MTLRFGGSEKRARFSETAYGFSRYALDDMLLSAAVAGGASLHREKASPAYGATVIAHGRQGTVARGRRLFAFKAHFRGPVDDGVELFFLPSGGYAGVSAVEGGATNVCGLAPENTLAAVDFNIDQFVNSHDPLRRRLDPLHRTMDWIHTGPLVFSNRLRGPFQPGIYPAGDALSFVDPFSGSGILAAVATGELAGRAAAEGMEAEQYLRKCGGILGQQIVACRLFRLAILSGWAPALLPLIPSRLLFSLTRPSV